jgi:NADPH2:quinone reductase
MRALQVTELSGPLGLRLAEVPEPRFDDEVLIEVRAAGVTFPDLLMTEGKYQVQPELPFVPGLEVAGTVLKAPRGSDLSEGDRVAAYTGWGGYSEMVAVPASNVVSLPPGVDYVDGVAMMVNYQTAYFALADRGRVVPGETVLVHGAAGGVGSAAVQVAAGLGARVIAVVNGAKKSEVARRAGAEEIIDVSGDWLSNLRRLTGQRGVDVIFDPVGGDRFDTSLRGLAPGGRILVIGFAEGRIPTIRANYLLLKNIEAVGVAWGAYLPLDPDMPRRIGLALAGLVERGFIKPVIGSTYPLAEGQRALEDLAARRTLGKSVLVVR